MRMPSHPDLVLPHRQRLPQAALTLRWKEVFKSWVCHHTNRASWHSSEVEIFPFQTSFIPTRISRTAPRGIIQHLADIPGCPTFWCHQLWTNVQLESVPQSSTYPHGVYERWRRPLIVIFCFFFLLLVFSFFFLETLHPMGLLKKKSL